MNSKELFLTLYKSVEFDWQALPFWWPGSEFEILISTILTQNTKWSAVEKSLQNLANSGVDSLENLAKLEVSVLANLIKPSGFYNTKAKRLMSLANQILAKFGNLQNFKNRATREWLLSQKGLGFESCDAILCYLCKKEIMVVDSYTMRIFGFLGYEFESYDEASSWLMDIDFCEINEILGLNLSQNELFARYHGVIVEFCKSHLRGKNFSQEGEEILSELF